MNEKIAKMCEWAAKDSEVFHWSLVADMWNCRAAQARSGKVLELKFRDWLFNIRDYYLPKDRELAEQAEKLAGTYEEVNCG